MLEAIWSILCDTAVYILVGFAIAAALHAWVAGGRVVRWLSERRPRSVVLATLVGVPLPLCSCSVLPAAITLRRKGASRGATLSFLISTPETSATSILMTYSLLGGLLAVFRPIAACVTAIAAGLVENLVGRQEDSAPATGPAADKCCGGGDQGAAEAEPAEAPRGLRAGLRYAFVELFDDIFVWIVVGIVAAAAIQALLPQSVFEAFFGRPLLAMLLMLVVGIPLYICAESSTPIAAALIAQGMNPGAALVLLLTGPATNIGAVGVLYRELGRRTVVIYLTTIALVALLMGVLLNALVGSLPAGLNVRAFGEELLPGWLKICGAVGFLLLGLFTLRRQRYWPRLVDWLDRRLPVRVTTRRLVAVAGLLALLAYLASGMFVVQPGEVGVVRRFGAIVRSDLGPGLHYAWPVPIERADRVPVARVNRLVFGFFDTPQDPRNPEPDPDEAWLLVGDENIADIKASVHWGGRRDQVINFRFGVERPAELVRCVTLAAMREVLGGASINRAFTTKRYRHERAIEALIQQRLDEYGAGIRIDSFCFLDAHAPPDVHEAFRDVASALEDRSMQVNLARRDENRIIPLARGEAVRNVTEAAGRAARIIAQAKGAAVRFLELVGVYQRWPVVTRRRMYLETLEGILPRARKYIRTAGTENGELEIWLVNPRLGAGLPWQTGPEAR